MASDRRACVILNAGAGFDDKRDTAQTVERVFSEFGYSCELLRIHPGTPVDQLARQAVRRGAERVIAGGGDGTLRAVASAVTGTQTAMGVLPVGTLNHFARDMEIPLDVPEAARIAASGEVVCVDAAEVNGAIFLNNATFGLYPFYRGHRDTAEMRGLPRIWAIVRAIARMVWRYPVITLRMQVNGRQIVRRTPYVLVANNAHALEGYKPWERESMTEGKLWIYVLRDRSRWAILRMLLKIAMGRRLAFDELEVFRASEVVMETHARRMLVSVDGEILPLQTPLHFRSRPGELRVIVPAGSKRMAESACPIGEEMAR